MLGTSQSYYIVRVFAKNFLLRIASLYDLYPLNYRCIVDEVVEVLADEDDLR